MYFALNCLPHPFGRLACFSREGGPMIARMWHGAVAASKQQAYREYLEKTGVPDSRATPGNRGVVVLERRDGEVAHFVFISLWESLGAIRAFAGDDLEKARYYPEDAAFLLELEPAVTHHEVGVLAGLEVAG